MPSDEFRILSPTAILGYGFPEESFLRGIARRPDLIAVDAGSTDPGPYYLGSGKSFTNRAFVKRDLRYMLIEGLTLGTPVVVGTAGGSGAAPHLAWCRSIIEEIAREEKLTFRLGVIAADVPKETVKASLRAGKVRPLPFVPDLTEEAIDDTTHLVAQMGYEPLARALDAGCQVVLAGRCYDPANFAALPILCGFDEAMALHLGKILECGAIAATPGSGADCAFGTLTRDRFILEALSPHRMFTRESTAAHTLYEKSDPYHLPGPGGVLHLENCVFTELGDGRVEVRHGWTEMGQGVHTVALQVACSELGIDPDRVDVVVDTTRELGFGQTTGSRGTLMAAGSVAAALFSCGLFVSHSFLPILVFWSLANIAYGGIGPVIDAAFTRRMAKSAINTQRCGHEVHHLTQLAGGHVFQHRDVLKLFSGRFLARCKRGLGRRRRAAVLSVRRG